MRPVAIAGAWCRMFDKYVATKATEDYALHLLPTQLGVGLRGAAEILVWGIDMTMEQNPEIVVVKLDLQNAHKCV